MPKFSMSVPDDLLDVIRTVRAEEGLKKGVAIEYLLHLARLKPDAEPVMFKAEKTGPCNLGLKDAQMFIFRKFRAAHRPILDADGLFFEYTLKIGASAHHAGYRLSESKAFENAILIAPPPPG